MQAAAADRASYQAQLLAAEKHIKALEKQLASSAKEQVELQQQQGALQHEVIKAAGERAAFYEQLSQVSC